MKSTKLTFIIIIVLALLAGFGAYSYLSSAKTTIFLFKDSYPAGTKITEDILVPHEIDSKIVNEIKLESYSSDGSMYITIDNKDQVMGDSLKGDVIKGTAFMSTETSKYGGSPSEARLDANTIAVTVPADNVTGVSAFIKSGSRVNVFAGYQGNNGNASETMILQNIKVVDVEYSEVKNESTNSPTVSGVTLQVTPEQAVAVNFAAEFGKVRLGVTKPGSYKETNVSPYNMDNVKPMASAQTQTESTSN